MDAGVQLSLAAAGAGGVVMVAALARARREAPAVDPFLSRFEPGSPESRLAQPLLPRLLGAAARAVAARVERYVPRNYLDNLDQQLAHAGLTAKRRAGEQLAIQVGLTAAGAVVMALLLAAGADGAMRLSLLLLPAMGWMLPSARLKRAIRTRSEAIFKDLPDIIDMLAIAVEAGSGFEAALSIVCENFDSPLTEELSIALREMELGMPRRQALQELRSRADLDVVRTFVLALLQADALGIPIGRVLKGQANEVRSKRRAWAREKAAKLPVKILFPLVLFIFPPILALVLGPAAGSMGGLG